MVHYIFLIPIFLLVLWLIYIIVELPKLNGLNVGLLRKIKKKWKIIQINDPTMNNKLIYRGLRNGKIVPYAWHEDKFTLINIIAYTEVYGSGILDNYGMPYNNMLQQKENRIKERKIKKQKSLIKKTKHIWP